MLGLEAESDAVVSADVQSRIDRVLFVVLFADFQMSAAIPATILLAPDGIGTVQVDGCIRSKFDCGKHLWVVCIIDSHVSWGIYSFSRSS